jgi:hypothetical protein
MHVTTYCYTRVQTLQVIARAPELLLPTAQGGTRQLWLEVDSSHPALLEQQLLAGPTAGVTANVTEFEWYRDLGGHPRFCRIKFAD